MKVLLSKTDALNVNSYAAGFFTFFSDPIILLFAAGMAIGVLKQNLGGRFVLRYPFWIAVALLGVQILVNIVPLRQLEVLQVRNARKQGWSWQEIAEALRVSKQAVHKKHAGREK